ncbi:mechanosensitive ion channel domain-containing protein [Marinoscillum sp.]|uniref:mechanosensitive ion channel domain-containing protein n=1 Tax=Marinoscillum sp. TaxID=2024838 RepID=UPI003BA9D58D
MYLIEYLKSADSLTIQLSLTLLFVVVYIIVTKLTDRIIRRFGRKNEIALPRVVYTIKYFRFVLLVFILLLLGITWDISFEGLSVYFLSFFTVAGVGLFASWSILSNVTSAIILFFYFPYRIGDRIRIVDGDNSIEGIVFDLNMFSIVIKNEHGQKVTYPNNVALQKAIIMLK